MSNLEIIMTVIVILGLVGLVCLVICIGSIKPDDEDEELRTYEVHVYVSQDGDMETFFTYHLPEINDGLIELEDTDDNRVLIYTKGPVTVRDITDL